MTDSRASLGITVSFGALVMKITIGLMLAFAVGAGCRATGVPLPAPPVLIGALIVAAMSAGYVVTDRFVRIRAAKLIVDDGPRSRHKFVTKFEQRMRWKR